ncbi:hypothetical protein SRHO_G00309050 [Serrasalmus rhombeus]
MMNDEENTVSPPGGKRLVKPTRVSLENDLQMRISSRRAKLGKLTEKRNEMLALMDDDANVEIITQELLDKYKELIGKFRKINADIKDVYSQLGCVENMERDQSDWFQPKYYEHSKFVQEMNLWIQDAMFRIEESTKLNNEINPEDSASATSRKSKKAKSVSAASVVSLARAERLKVELEQAILLTKTATLKQKRALEEQELQLKADKEELELQAELDESDAKLAVLRKYEEGSNVSRGSKGGRLDSLMATQRQHDGHNRSGGASNVSQHSHSGGIAVNAAPVARPVSYAHQVYATPKGNSANTDNLVSVMQRQNEITESLIKQQKLTLPSPNILVFKGDPMEYRLFMRAFEHCIESKTENSKDRLYYLEQHTTGQPNDLVRSCFHMDPEQGYFEAKKLLKERFGDKYKISMAYLDKALNWPTIKSDDVKALEAYALFLTNCDNAMSDLEYLDEMENAANMRTVISKLPYRLREKFRSIAIDIQKKDRRTKFKDVVSFITKQAEMAAHPVFGEISGQTKRQPERSTGKKNITTLATEAKEQKAVKDVGDADNKKAKEKKPNMNMAFMKPCIFCQGDHTMEQCKKLQKRLHKEKIEFLKSKGLCFSCLIGGHMSSTCEEKKSCEMCSAKHPTLLHIKQKPKDIPKENALREEQKEESSQEEQQVVSGFVDAGETCSQTGAGSTGTVLPIVPVRVKAKKGNKVLTCYAFLDPGSNASFCTNKLANNPNLQGTNVNILLTTMGDQKAVSCKVLPDLEVSSLEGDDFVELNGVFTQKAIPASQDNIPTQEAVDRWPHLRGVRIPSIKADVDLLIGTDVAKALEPQEVIRSVKDGPYAVRTVLGWTVNGPLRESIRSWSEHGYPQIQMNRISVTRLEELWMQQFKYDFPENALGEQREMSKEDQLFMDRVTTSTKLVNGHYFIGLPLKNKDVKMPNNRAVTEQRVLNMKKKLQKNQTFREEYVSFMNQVISMGYAVKVPDKELNRSDGKARVAPLKPTTIPRLELTAAALAVKVDVMLKKELQLPLADSKFWTDSTAVLKYIANENIRFKTFVANRIAIILQASNVHQWSYVNTQLNPADCASRGQMVSTFMKNEVWIAGPSFLNKPEREWPVEPDHQERSMAEDPEVKKSILVNATIVESTDAMQQLIQYFSSWIRLKKAVAWFTRLKQTLVNLSRKRKELKGSCSDEQQLNKEMLSCKRSLEHTYLTVEDLQKAEIAIIGHCQNNSFQEEISALRRKDSVKKSSRIFRLNPQLEEGILRVGGRLSRASMPTEAKHPMIIPKNHHVADLILQDAHERLGHSGHNHVLSHVRQRADHEMKKAIKEWNAAQIENSLLQRDIKWLFNPPSRSHHGGVWERIIRSVRKIMNATLKEQSLDEEGLQTFFCECEAILNSRPITTPSNDINDLEALTTQHLLLLKTNPNLPTGVFDEDDTYARKRWRQVQYMSDLFWKRWTREYLPQLQKRQKWNRPARNFSQGDVVLIVDESAPRGSWLMGRIVKIVVDEHGVVRKVRVKTKTNELERPITKLCLLQEAE